MKSRNLSGILESKRVWQERLCSSQLAEGDHILLNKSAILHKMIGEMAVGATFKRVFIKISGKTLHKS